MVLNEKLLALSPVWLGCGAGDRPCAPFTCFALSRYGHGAGNQSDHFPQGLANHLKKINAKMYGAYWCPACMKQKELFGSAFKSINYIECDARGTNGQPELCKQANIRAYPTWEINGKRYEGVYPLEGLAQLSGYQGR